MPFASYNRLAVAVLAAGLLLASAPAVAHAATYIQVTSAGSQPSTVGSLSIGFNSTSPVVPGSISAKLYASGASTPALTVTGFSLTAGTNTGAGATTWTVTTPITQQQLPLGTYTIAVQAADTGGDSTDDPGAGTLLFLVEPTLTLNVSPTTYSYGQDVTISVTDIGLYPDATTRPVSGQNLQVDQEVYLGTTDGQGKVSATWQAGVGSAEILGNATVAANAVPDSTTAAAPVLGVVPVTVVRVPVRVSGLRTSPTHVSYSFSGTFTIDGTISYQSGSTWQPYAGGPLAVQPQGFCMNEDPVDPECGPIPISAATGPDGSISLSLPDSGNASDTYMVNPAPGPLWFLQSSPCGATELVDHVPTRVDFSALRNARGGITLTACRIPDIVGNGLIDTADRRPYPVSQFQYARSITGPWRTLPNDGALRPSFGPPNGVSGCYQASISKRARSTFYRFASPATIAYATPGPYSYARGPESSSIKGFAVSPRRVRAGQRIKVSGQVVINPPLLVNLTVEILFRSRGSSRWRVRSTLTSDPYGHFSGPVTIRASGFIESATRAAR